MASVIVPVKALKHLVLKVPVGTRAVDVDTGEQLGINQAQAEND